MKKELRILMLEDAPADATLIGGELRRAGIAFRLDRVEDRETFVRELERNAPDVILSDHGLPSFDGFAALELARQRRPETPFIFITGSMGEELAIESLRSGANDYVLKSRLGNLVPAIERALRLADERSRRVAAEHELRQSEERFRMLVGGVKDYAICMLDPAGTITSWNAGAELLLGYSSEEAVGTHFDCFYRAPDREAKRPEEALRIAATKGRFEEEGWRVRKDGAVFWAHADLRSLRDDSGKVRAFTQVIRDATERMRAEEALRKSEERYRRLVELCPDALLLLHEGRIAFLNTATVRLFDAEGPESLLGRPFVELIHPDDRESVTARLNRLHSSESGAPWGPGDSAGRPPAFTEETILRTDGSELSVEIAATRMTFQGEPRIQLIIHDISVQKAAAEAVRESEARKAAVLETSLDAIVGFDHKGIIREWNSAAERIFAYRHDDAVGMRFEKLFARPPPGQPRPPGTVDLSTGGAPLVLGRPVEVIARRSSGEEFPCELAVTEIRAADPPFYTAFMRDIADRKNAEEALRRSETRKSAILENALDAVVTIDAESKVIEWNPAAGRIFGYSRELALGRSLSELLSAGSNEELARKGLSRYLQTGRGRLLGHRMELTAVRANGAEFPVEITISQTPGEGQSVFTSFIRDITERKHTDEALRKSEERFRLLVEGVEDYAIYMLDTHGRVTTWNAGAERIHGYRAQEIVGRRFHRFYTQEDCERKKPDQAIAVATSEGRYQEEHWLVRKTGAQFWASFVITALRDERGRLTGFSTIARDVTQRRNAEEEIRRLNAALERQVRERTAELEAAHNEMEAFSYSISHDLRAPLIHITGFVEMLKSELGPGLDERSRRHLDTICSSTEHMGRMIADLLAFSRIGRAEIHRIRLSLDDLLRDVRGELSPDLQNRQVAWIVGELPEVVADPVLMRQVLLEMIKNALKFSRGRPEARIEVGASRTPSEDIVHVRDNGIGFNPTYAGKLFGVFQRLHSASDFEGEGMGLAKVRRIIQRHGGRTWAEGAPDGGATFFFSLPRPGPESK